MSALCICNGDWHEFTFVSCGNIITKPCEFSGRHSQHDYSTYAGSGVDAHCPGVRPAVYVSQIASSHRTQL